MRHSAPSGSVRRAAVPTAINSLLPDSGIVVPVTVSLKGVLIGSITDILSSSLSGVPLAIYAASKVDLANTPKDQLGHAIAAVSRATRWLYGTQFLLGLTCSVLGGYVAAWLAKHDEL